MSLIEARALPDGTFEYHDAPGTIDRLRLGDATLGWAGDENLSLCVDSKRNEWVVYYRGPDGINRPCMRKPRRQGEGVPTTALIREIVAHDTRHIDVVAQVDKLDLARERRKQAEFREKTGEYGDKLAHALGRDLDIPAQDGRYYPLSGRK